jgi:hypothetical protein
MINKQVMKKEITNNYDKLIKHSDWRWHTLCEMHKELDEREPSEFTLSKKLTYTKQEINYLEKRLKRTESIHYKMYLIKRLKDLYKLDKKLLRRMKITINK